MNIQQNNYQEEIIKMIRDDIGWKDEGQTITADTSLVQDLALDSVMLVQLIVLIEDKYQVEFQDSHELFQGMNTIGSLAQWIMQQKGMFVS